MKRINIAILFFLLASAIIHGQETEYDLLKISSWEQVKAKAKQENKHIFLDFYATWCGMCKHMDANVYTDKEIGEFFNRQFHLRKSTNG